MWWNIPGSLEVKDHMLYISGLNSRKIAEDYGTPLYVTDGDRVEENYNRLFKSVQQYLSRKLSIHYSIKANSNIILLKLLKGLGSSVDSTSPFEVRAAKEAGFLRDDIICTGTSFSDDDMLAVGNTAVMNIDSISQLRRYANLVSTKGFDKEISIRVNPGKGAGHCPDCVTAGEDAKYGVPEKEALSTYGMALDYGLIPIGIHQHIGSGILPPNLDVLYENVGKLMDMAGKISNSYNVIFKFIDFGGGLGIPYKKSDVQIDLDSFGRKFGSIVEQKASEYGLGLFEVYLEPGRFIVGDSTILLTNFWC